MHQSKGEGEWKTRVSAKTCTQYINYKIKTSKQINKICILCIYRNVILTCMPFHRFRCVFCKNHPLCGHSVPHHRLFITRPRTRI